MKVVLKNGLTYKAIPISQNIKTDKKGNVIKSELNYLNTTTNTVHIVNEFGRQTFVFPNEIDWEKTQQINRRGED